MQPTINEDDMMQVIGIIQQMDLPQLRVIKDQVEHEIMLALKEADYNGM